MNTPPQNARTILIITSVILFILFLPAITNAEKPPDWQESSLIRNVLEAHDDALPRGLSHVVAYSESRFKSYALSRNTQDRGLMQINKEYQDYIAWRHTEIPASSFKWDNPEHSAIAGCNYLSYLINRFGGSVYLGLVAYNWGEGNLSRITRLEDIPKKVVKYVDMEMELLDEWVEGW